MRKWIAVLLALLILGYGLAEADMNQHQIDVQVGEDSFAILLENNESAVALMAMLADGPITIPCSNYGGFEKVCRLGRTLPSSDSRLTTVAGDVMLYSGNQMVIFYNSNTWAYTRLGRVADEDIPRLADILSGPETEITLSTIADEPVKYAILPENLQFIGDEAFHNTALTHVVLPAGILEIGEGAFDGEVIIHGTPGTEAQRYADENNIPFQANVP